MESKLNDIQRVLLDTFKAFAKFCNDNDIQYFAAYGTMLGAIRHKGFIPWDDDMDVLMTRDNYDKFMSLKHKLAEETDYWAADYNDKGYPYDFAKFYDSKKTFWEYPQFPFVFGPFIDIFPLDNWEVDGAEHLKLYDEYFAALWKYRKSIAYHPWEEIFNDLKGMDLFGAGVKIIKKIYYVPLYRVFYNRVRSVEDKIRALPGRYYKVFFDFKNMYYEKSWFDGVVECPFEDTTILVPSGYDACLTKDYGDYMTPPEETKRSGHHIFFFRDLEKKLSRDEILKIKAKDKGNTRKLSFKILLKEFRHRNSGY